MVRSGLEVLLDSHNLIEGNKKIGLVSQPAAVTHQFTDSITALQQRDFNLAALFGPEHGLLGAAADGAAVDNARDARTGLPVFSLYGKTRQPTPEMLAGIDLLVFDMQDVGVRFYTFLSTLINVMKGAAAVGMPVLVLDRPNPINGLGIDGPLLQPGLESFVGALPIPIRHGLTLGELALFANDRLGIGAKVGVVRMAGWQRGMWFDQTGLPWVPTSPGMPHLSSVTVYAGMCLVEGTNLSEGRGTALPFEVAGAPWLDNNQLCQRLNSLGLPGVVFRPTAFTPTTSKHKEQVCLGVQVHVTERDVFNPILSALEFLGACREAHPQSFEMLPSSWEGRPAHFDLLTGSTAVRSQFLAGIAARQIVESWQADVELFRLVAKSYWLYPS